MEMWCPDDTRWDTCSWVGHLQGGEYDSTLRSEVERIVAKENGASLDWIVVAVVVVVSECVFDVCISTT